MRAEEVCKSAIKIYKLAHPTIRLRYWEMKAILIFIAALVAASAVLAYTDKVYFKATDGFGPKGNWSYGTSSDPTAAKNAVVVWQQGCASGNEYGYFSMDSGASYARRVEIRHLETSADDSFKLYIKSGTSWVLVGTYKNWYNDTRWLTNGFNLPDYKYKGKMNFMIKATGPASSNCKTRGQVAVYYAKLYIVPMITTTLTLKMNAYDPEVHVGAAIMMSDHTTEDDIYKQKEFFSYYQEYMYDPDYLVHMNQICNNPFDSTNTNLYIGTGRWMDIKIESNLYNGESRLFAKESNSSTYKLYGKYKTTGCSAKRYNMLQLNVGLQRSTGAEMEYDDVVVKYSNGNEATIFSERFDDDRWNSRWKVSGGTMSRVPDHHGTALRMTDTTTSLYTSIYRDFDVPNI
jgi:hypothetical protein